jgi:hypothetical protein
MKPVPVSKAARSLVKAKYEMPHTIGILTRPERELLLEFANLAKRKSEWLRSASTARSDHG